MDDEKDSNLSGELMLHTPIFDVLRRPEASAGFRPVAVHAPDWVSVCAQKGGKWLVTRQLRFGTMKEVVEFPCGCVEEGEASCVAAARELAEETGYVVDVRDMEKLGSFATNPGFMTNRMHYFFVDLDSVPHRKQEQKLDEHEQLTCEWMDADEFRRQFLEDAGCSPVMVAGMLYLLEKRSKAAQDEMEAEAVKYFRKFRRWPTNEELDSHMEMLRKQKELKAASMAEWQVDPQEIECTHLDGTPMDPAEWKPGMTVGVKWKDGIKTGWTKTEKWQE